MNLSTAEKTYVIGIARNRILKHLGIPDRRGWAGESPPEPLKRHGGVFVSLYTGDQLRGCIGTFSEQNPLYVNVREMAFSAAFGDPRFSSVERDDVPNLRIEVSLLSPRVPISGPSEIELGRHGIFLRKGSRRGTLLPQVAVKQNWSREEFLGHCSRDKAGLEWDGWKDAELFTYEATIISSDVAGEAPC